MGFFERLFADLGNTLLSGGAETDEDLPNTCRESGHDPHHNGL